MRPYADTNLIVALLCKSPHEAAARSLRDGAEEDGGLPFPITFVGRMEIKNAIEQQVFFARAGASQVHFTTQMALLAEALLLDELIEETTLRSIEIELSSLEQIFNDLSHRHTARHGFRTYDILHVASALLLGCDTFWSFDAKARKLAKLEGLLTN